MGVFFFFFLKRIYWVIFVNFIFKDFVDSYIYMGLFWLGVLRNCPSCLVGWDGHNLSERNLLDTWFHKTPNMYTWNSPYLENWKWKVWRENKNAISMPLNSFGGYKNISKQGNINPYLFPSVDLKFCHENKWV